MQIVTLVEAQAQLIRLIELVAAGEEVMITRDGQAVVKMVTPTHPPTMPGLADFRAAQPEQHESAGDFLRRLRETDRY